MDHVLSNVRMENTKAMELVISVNSNVLNVALKNGVKNVKMDIY